MRIAWTDLNNVQEAGDYPVRDGQITITFAEIAVWKNNPRATFRLMRGPSPAAIGTRRTMKTEAGPAKIFYAGGNGDS
jgi:hypothetical protein